MCGIAGDRIDGRGKSLEWIVRCSCVCCVSSTMKSVSERGIAVNLVENGGLRIVENGLGLSCICTNGVWCCVQERRKLRLNFVEKSRIRLR